MKTNTAEKIVSQRRRVDPDFEPELRKLSDLAFVFLYVSDGDPAEAEDLLENFIDLIFEGGTLSTWRYRIVLANIREGL